MSTAIKTLPAVTVGTTPVQIDSRGVNYHKYAAVRVQADPTNSGTVYVGDSNVSTSRWAAALSAGDFYVLQGAAVDPTRVWVVASVAAQVIHPSGS